MKQTIVCIQCPLGCRIKVEETDQGYRCRGHQCPRGESYAVQEVRDPRRVLTTTVRVTDGVKPLLPVRSETAIPKDCLKDAVVFLSTVVVEAPVKKGQVIIGDICGTGVNVIASCDLPRR